jgi:hypothetical protein
MKKKMIALLAGALMMLGASNAFAYIQSDLELYRVVFDATTGSTFQTISDLGSLATLNGKADGTLLDSATSAFTSVAGYGNATQANLQIAYFAYNAVNPNQDVYLSQTGESAAPTIAGLKWGTAGLGLKTAAGSGLAVNGATYDASGMTVQNQLNTLANGFKVKEHSNFGGYFTGGAVALGEPTLATLAGNAALTTHLYFFDQSNTGQTGVLADSLNGTISGNWWLTTDVANGTTTIHTASAATPIPAAIYLMGSGLLGMFGLRRKQRA